MGYWSNPADVCSKHSTQQQGLYSILHTSTTQVHTPFVKRSVWFCVCTTHMTIVGTCHAAHALSRAQDGARATSKSVSDLRAHVSDRTAAPWWLDDCKSTGQRL